MNSTSVKSLTYPEKSHEQIVTTSPPLDSIPRELEGTFYNLAELAGCRLIWETVIDDGNYLNTILKYRIFGPANAIDKLYKVLRYVNLSLEVVVDEYRENLSNRKRIIRKMRRRGKLISNIGNIRALARIYQKDICIELCNITREILEKQRKSRSESESLYVNKVDSYLASSGVKKSTKAITKNRQFRCPR